MPNSKVTDRSNQPEGNPVRDSPSNGTVKKIVILRMQCDQAYSDDVDCENCRSCKQAPAKLRYMLRLVPTNWLAVTQPSIASEML